VPPLSLSEKWGRTASHILNNTCHMRPWPARTAPLKDARGTYWTALCDTCWYPDYLNCGANRWQQAPCRPLSSVPCMFYPGWSATAARTVVFRGLAPPLQLRLRRSQPRAANLHIVRQRRIVLAKLSILTRPEARWCLGGKLDWWQTLHAGEEGWEAPSQRFFGRCS
jgi:hypothetical protein